MGRAPRWSKKGLRTKPIHNVVISTPRQAMTKAQLRALANKVVQSRRGNNQRGGTWGASGGEPELGLLKPND
jgi:hypothetical protein